MLIAEEGGQRHQEQMGICCHLDLSDPRFNLLSLRSRWRGGLMRESVAHSSLPTVGKLLRIREEKGKCGWVFESVECPGGMGSRQHGIHSDGFEWYFA